MSSSVVGLSVPPRLESVPPRAWGEGDVVRVEWLRFLRAEMKFANVEELRAQIARDREHEAKIVPVHERFLSECGPRRLCFAAVKAFVIDRYGLDDYLPFYKYGDVCVWDAAIVVGVGGGATTDLAGGESAVLDISSLPPGDYEMICDLPGHTAAGMKATIIMMVVAIQPCALRMAPPPRL